MGRRTGTATFIVEDRALARTIGQGWSGYEIFSPGDWDGDNKTDILARDPNGLLLLYSGDGSGDWSATAQPIGHGWNIFIGIHSVGDFSGDGHPDVLAVRANGRLFMYRGDGSGGWSGSPLRIGTGWNTMIKIL